MHPERSHSKLCKYNCLNSKGKGREGKPCFGLTAASMHMPVLTLHNVCEFVGVAIQFGFTWGNCTGITIVMCEYISN